MSENKLKTEELEQGKIYYLDYGSNTQIIGRYKSSDVCNHFFYDLLHYWNGYESFRNGNQYCVTSGIENLRRASKAEIHNFVKHEIENDCYHFGLIHTIIMQNKIQGGQELELKFVDETRIYLNFWDSIHGNDVCCQIKDGKIYQFIYTPKEVEEDELKDEPEIDDVFEEKEISLNEFIELVQLSVLAQAE